MRMRLRLLAAVLIAVVTLSSASGSARAQAEQGNNSAEVMLLSYYSAINLRNYPEAYAYWVNTPQTYDDFAAGYADTDHVEPYFGVFQPAVSSAAEIGRVPAVLFGYHTDGSVVSYYGCFVIYPTSTGLRILNASFRLISTTYLPDSTAMLSYLSLNCYNLPPSLTTTINRAPTDRGRALMNAYYGLINRRDYASAYVQWLQPIPGPKPNGAPPADYRLSYNDFAAGYADTVYVTAYYGDYQQTGAYAGHGYLDGLQPAVLVGLHTDGSVAAFYGCYVLGGGAVPGGFGIVSGKFLPLTTGDVPTGDIILRALGVDCVSLGLQT